MRRSLLLSIALTLTVASPALAKVKWFHSPSKNISCEVSSGGERGAYAFCQSLQKPRSVTLSKQGTLKVCHGTKCLGDGPEDAFELGYGKSVKVGNFKCTSKKAGMRCSVSPSGHGFELSRDALAPADAAERIPRAFVGDWCQINSHQPPPRRGGEIYKRTRPNACLGRGFTIRPDGTIDEDGDSDGCKIMPVKFIKPNDFLAKLRCGDEITSNRRFTMDSGRMILRF